MIATQAPAVAAVTVTTITLDPGIRRAVTERIVYEADPGFRSPPQPYAVTDGHGIRFVAANQTWDPWLNGTPVVAVAAFVDTRHNRFSAYPASGADWQICEQYPEWERAYRVVTGATKAAPVDVAAWVHEDLTYGPQLQGFLAACETAARDFVWSELCHTVELDATGIVLRRYGHPADNSPAR